jgi:uncharacterized damage-inducible protein DinB
MPDQKPPRQEGDERRTLGALLQYQRDSMVRKVSGVDADQARQSPVPSGTTLLWLITHMAQAESLWVVHRFAGEPEPPPYDMDAADASLAGAVDHYRQTWARVDAIGAASSLEATCRQFDDAGTVNLRWVLTHLLEETARHAGHADVLRELIDGQTGR